ncbi:MAG: ribonuclease Z [Sphingobacteriales bacterium]|nr:ribonuclease Z [Sphingobacteriales bacterium]
MLGITILGNNSALPAHDRHPTAQLLTTPEHLLLFDCGEGTQMQLARYKIRRSKINYIFISHLHGDHYFGLPGLLNSMGLQGRTQELHLFIPEKLKAILELQFEVANAVLPFKIHYHFLQEDGVILEEKKFTVSCFKTQHRIECWGFLFKEKKHPRKILPDECIKHEIPAAFYERLHWGEDYINKDGEVIKNDWVTKAATPPRSYAYSADTIFDEGLVEKVKESSLLFHETTYLKDQEERAAARFHSTTVQAAMIAKKANVNRLIIGHFSSKYDELDEFEKEAKEVFENCELAIEGVTYLL